MLNALSPHERSLFVESYDGEQCNGFRPRRWQSQGLCFELRIPRTRSGAFRPMILGILKEQEEEHTALFHELYVRGLTCKDIGEFANASMAYNIVNCKLAYSPTLAGRPSMLGSCIHLSSVSWCFISMPPT